jgi:2-isopropylmalate synthase
MPHWKRLAAALYVRADRYGVSTGLNLDKLYPTSQVLGQLITFKPLAQQGHRWSDNAFAHESGIHQHGMLANPLCYEIMTPAWWAWREHNLVLGKHSGRAALRNRLEAVGLYAFAR